MRTAMKTFYKIILILLALCVIPLGLFSQSTGISGDNTINRCEVKSYTISLQNNSGNDLTNLVIVARLENLVGFSYVNGTSSIDLNGGGAFCTAEPTISGGYSGGCAPAPGAPYLTWDIDAQCPGSPFTLADGDTLNITFQLETDCTAVSGSLNTFIDYTLPGPTPMCDDTGVLNIQVNPGAVTIKKTPNVIPRVLGQDVTWTLTIENTGIGIIENVEVTDELDSGLAYVSSTQNGNNSGQTTTWTSNEYAALASMDPGDILTMDITATVIACDNLNNEANVRFGCEPSPSNTCYDTSVDGGTARAAVQRIVRNPNLTYSPPDITFDYCNDTESVGPFTITNVGDGAAYETWIYVDFGPLTVSNITATPLNFTDPGFTVSYNTSEMRFEVTADPTDGIPPGGQFELSFDLTYSAWCGGGFPNGDILWQNRYLDECSNEFFPPVQLSTMNPPANTSSLSVSKNGAGAVIQIGDPVTYTITSSYSGPINCGSGTTGAITVVDTVPAGFTVTGAGGGVWVPGGDGTGGTITWTYTPPASLNTTVTFQSPLVDQCETYCNTTFTNSITASGIDCCGCSLSASDSETTAIECAEGVTSDKTSSSPTERCSDTTYTNTYNFSASSGVLLNDLQFEEHAELQQEYNSNLTVMLGAANVTGCVAVTDNTPGGSLLLDFSGCAATSLAGQTLTITYDLTATVNTVAACNNNSFYSWSSLDMGPSGSNCLGDGVIHEATVVNVVSPSMSLSITGLGQIFHTCESKTITMTLIQTSTNTSPKDVKLVLSGLNYYVVNPAATICGGVAPVSCTPSIDGSGNYIWEYGDVFTGSGQSATIQLEVQKRCSGTGDLEAIAYFDDLCTDDATSDELCSVVATETPALLLSGDLLIEKTPETYYAINNQVQWEIYVTNRGTGNAYNVWVDDVLGSGLVYEHGVNPVVVDDMTGVTINDSLDHNGGAINGASVEIASMAAGERRQITFVARQVDCNNLTNDVTSSWGCIGLECQTPVTDNSIVNIPAPNLINTNTITPSGGVDACSSPDGFITLRNAGQITCYNLQVTETLPPNLLYVSGSTRWRLNGGAWNGPDVAYDPNPTTSPLVWTSTEISALATSAPGDTIEIEFEMTSDCPFTGGDITCVTQYENPCADVFNTAVSTFSAAFNAPDITIDKSRADEPVDCNDAIQWTITVTNNSGYTLPIVWIEDTMDASFTYVSSVGDPPYTSDNGTNVGQVVTWELRNVNHGDTVTLTLNATTDSAPCSPDLDNTVVAYWGCGLADGSSATKPGVDAPDDSLCLAGTGVTDVRTETRQPALGYLSIAMSPGSIDSCNDSTQLTIVMENTGDVDAYTIDLAITLPTGITYNSGTAESGLGTDQASATSAIGAIGDPAISGNTITFYDINDKGSNIAPVIQAAGGNDTLVLRFTVQSACYVTANVDYDLRFYDCCDDTQYTVTTQEQLTALFPDLNVTKTANLSQVGCGNNVEFTVEVTNNGSGNAEVVRVIDTLGDWLDYAGNFTEDQPGTITPAVIGGNAQIIGWEFNDLGPGATATFTFEATLNPDGLPNQNDCTDALRENNVEAQWSCGTTGDAVDDNPNTTGYDCSDSGSATAGPVTMEMPNLVVTSITPDVTCTSDGTFSGTISVRVTNNGDGDTSGTFTVEVTDGKGWTGTGTYGLTIAAGVSADVTIDTGTWTPDCQPCGVPYSFNATVDLNNDICECNESDNSTGSATTYIVPSPDLAVDSNALAVVCADDGQATITGTVTLINNGCNTAVNSNIPMRFTLYDNTGCSGGVLEQWTDSFSSVNIAAGGGTQTFTITDHTFTSNQCLDSTGCQVSVFVEADYNDSICECDGTNNTYCADNIAVNIPDIEVDGDSLTVACLGDGQVTVSGNITLINNGCGSNLNSNIPMRFTLYDSTGCSGNTISQWTQTFASVNIASGGGTQVFTITPQTVTSDMVTNSSGCQVSIFVEADYNGSVCECDGTDNTYCADNKNIDIPDLQISTDTLAITCYDDGQFTVSGTVTMLNNGCGSSLNSNIPVRFTIFDNPGCTGNQVAQWTETLSGANISASGGSQVFTISPQNLTADLVANSTGCQVSILMEADFNGTICESDGTDNTLCSNKTVNIPDLQVNTITPSVNCTADGSVSGTITVNVENIGCSDVVGAVVQLTSSCGSITFVNQTVNLTAGSNSDLTFNYTPTNSACTCNFTATIDPGNLICESNNTNNSATSTNYTPDIPDLEITGDTMSANCNNDEEVIISGSITVANNGCGSTSTDIPVRFTLYDNTGCSGNMVSTWTDTLTGVNINGGGGSQVFTISPQTVSTDLVANSTGCQFSVQVEVDYSNSICEFDGTNNTYCASTKNVDIPDLEGQSNTLGITCFSDGVVSVSGSVTVVNNGCGSNMTTDIPVRFTLFDNTGCSGNQLTQWTETLSSADIPSGGGTQTFTITSQTVASDLVANSTGCAVSIGMEIDYTNTICESNGSNNTYCAGNINIDMPDLEYSSDSLVITGTGDGAAQVSGNVTVVNKGCGSAMISDIPVRITIYDNLNCTGNIISQWTEIFSSTNIPAGGGTQTFTVTPQNISGNLCTSSANCRVSMLIELDHTASICESDGTDNNMCVDKNVDIPDLTIDAVASSIICNSDGSLTGTTVTVSNTGCGDATGVVVRLTSDCGLTFTDQVIDLTAGSTQDVFFPFSSGITTCTCNFTAQIDPDDNIAECDGTNNSGSSVQAMLIPDLEVQTEDLILTCLDDGIIRISGTVSLVNNGCGPDFTGDIPMRFTLFSRPGCSGSQVEQWTQTFTGVNMAASGGTQTFTIQIYDGNFNFCTNSTNCQVSMLIEADYNNGICEWDGTDNTYCTNKTSECRDLEAVELIPSIDCSEDASLGGSISFTLRNSGGNPITQDFYIRVDDGQGWSAELLYSGDLGGTLPLPAGASATVNFNWERNFSTDICEYGNITAQVDPRDEICQCSSDNDTITAAFQMPLPNLLPSTVSVSCSADGFYLVQVNVENNGCSDAGSFTVRLSDNQGNTRDITVEGLARGSSSTVDFFEWPAGCDPASVTFTAVVDANNEVCEITGTDNTMTHVYNNTSPDLVIIDVKPSASCRSAGDITGSFDITLQNNGNGPVEEDFKVIVNDGEGWSNELFYKADLNGTLPIAAGDTVNLRINWNREFNKEPFKCDFNNIMVGLDMQTNVCECAAANNDTVTTYKLPYPDLDMQSLLPICDEDGQRSLQLTIGNNGCEDQREDFNITFSDSSGQTRTVSFSTLGGSLPLRRGTTQTVTLAAWEFSCTGGMTEYTASLNFSGGLCDLVSTNNSVTLTHEMNESDLLFGDITWVCNGDGTITFTIAVRNQGYGDAANIPVRIYDGSGNLVHSRTIDLPNGAEAQFSFTAGPYAQGQSMTFRFVVDEDDQLCECDGTNNEKSTEVRCEGGGQSQLQLGKFCPPGQEPGGLFRFELQIRNTGSSNLSDVKITDFLPEGFQYVAGSSVMNGRAISDPQITGQLTWSIDVLPQGADWTLIFTAVADADIDPGRYCNEALAEASLYGDSVTVKSEQVRCCTVVTRETGAGCCLKVEEWPMSPRIIPDGPISFIEPYFHTETAMFTVYSIFNLWENDQLGKGSLSLFMKERLHNYARSTMEEFYLASKLGLTFPDGSIWLSFAGAYPERGHSWLRKQVDETMTSSQLGFELLALNEILKVEDRPEFKQKFSQIIENKLAFIDYFINDLPHAWEIQEKKKDDDSGAPVSVEEAVKKYVKENEGNATLYDKTALYLAMVELKNSGLSNGKIESFAAKLRELLQHIDNRQFDRNNLREELLFTLALLEDGRKEQAKAKIKEFESILATEREEVQEKQSQAQADNQEKPEPKRLLDTLHDYALAAAVDRKAGGSAYDEIMKKMKEKFYLKDTGVYAEVQPDFTFKLKLFSLAPMILSFDNNEPEKQEQYATVLYRTFDEVGLFLKKRNLSVGKPLYSLLKNYPFTEPLLPVLNFTKANRSIAPVFSQDAVIHSTQLKPIGEILIPANFSKILSPSYETGSARIAALSFGLQYMGRILAERVSWEIREEGRSFKDTGESYVDSLLQSGAGIQYHGFTLLPFDRLAIKGPKKDQHNLEPLNGGSGAEISTESMANFLLAEKYYVDGKGKFANEVGRLVSIQERVIGKFKDIGYVPSKFNILINKDTEEITIVPSQEKASRLTIAKLFHVLPKNENNKFLENTLKKVKGQLAPEDLIFLAAAPDLVPYFREEIQALVNFKDSKVAYNAADVVGRRLLGDDPDKIEDSLDNLKKHWDKEAILPVSDRVENIEKGLIYHHDPQQFLLYLLALKGDMEFRFERTLNFFTYLLENEWGVQWNSFLTLPSSEYQVFREEPKENAEPGDLLTFRVRVDNTCPEGYGSAHDLPSLYLKAAFSPSLIYAGTQSVDGLDVLGEFKWFYSGLTEGSFFEYIYQAVVPSQINFNFIDGWIYAGGRQGFEAFGPESAVGDDCEDIHHVQRLNIIPFQEIQGLVFEDKNLNNIKDVGERGIANILIKDTRGRVFRSDAEGRFTVLAGDRHEGLQVELKSIPGNYLMIENPTKLVNRHYVGEVYFGLIPTTTVTGFVYLDENGNNVYDEGEIKPEGVMLKAKDKEELTGKDGKFIFRNLPVLWRQWIEVKKEQLYYKKNIDYLKFKIL